MVCASLVSAVRYAARSALCARFRSAETEFAVGMPSILAISRGGKPSMSDNQITSRHRSGNDIVRSVTRGLTSIMARSWAAAFDPEDGVSAERLEEAKFHGGEEGADCQAFAPKAAGPGDKPVGDCDVLRQQEQQLDKMDLSYEHTEL